MMNLHHVFFQVLPALLLCSRAAHQSNLETIQVRLMNGSSQYEGTVQYSGNNGLSWHSVCGANLDINVVKVICRQLGFSGANRNIQYSPFGIGNEAPTTSFNCAGVEQTIATCNKYNTTCSSNGRQPGGAVCYDERYLGCFNDLPNTNSRVLSGNKLTSDELTIESCIMYCLDTIFSNYIYAGVKGGNECNCGDASADYGRYGMVGEDGCQVPCTGDAFSSCGGNSKIAIFNLSVVIPLSDKKTTDATLVTTNSILSTRPEMTTGFEDTKTTTSTKFGTGVGGSFLLITIIVIIVVKYKRRFKHVSSQGVATSGEPGERPGMRDNPTFESPNVKDLRMTDVASCHSGNDPYMALTTPHDGPTLQLYEPLREVISQGDGYEVPVNGVNGQTGPEYCKTLHRLQVHPETDYEITHEYQDLTNSVVGRNNSLGNASPVRGLQVKPETDYEAIHDYENPGIIG